MPLLDWRNRIDEVLKHPKNISETFEASLAV
jgi:hypothetical protein